MPHVVYLHSALTRDRFGHVEPGPARRRLIGATRTDVVFAMVLAGSVNIAMLLLAASALRGQDGVDTIEGAHAAVTNTLGPVVGVLFAVGLLASGLASTSVGCYAGSVIMEGLLHRKVNLLVRRVVTLIPALIVLAAGADPTTVLVISQVVLSFGIPFALVPLVYFTARRDIMGQLVNRPITTAAASLIAGVIIALNIFLLAQTAGL